MDKEKTPYDYGREIQDIQKMMSVLLMKCKDKEMSSNSLNVCFGMYFLAYCDILELDTLEILMDCRSLLKKSKQEIL